LEIQLKLVARGKEARGQSRNFRSGQYLIPDAPEEIRGAEIPALGALGELGVVKLRIHSAQFTSPLPAWLFVRLRATRACIYVYTGNFRTSPTQPSPDDFQSFYRDKIRLHPPCTLIVRKEK
jgi:hypothetical protein